MKESNCQSSAAAAGSTLAGWGRLPLLALPGGSWWGPGEAAPPKVLPLFNWDQLALVAVPATTNTQTQTSVTCSLAHPLLLIRALPSHDDANLPERAPPRSRSAIPPSSSLSGGCFSASSRKPCGPRPRPPRCYCTLSNLIIHQDPAPLWPASRPPGHSPPSALAGPTVGPRQTSGRDSKRPSLPPSPPCNGTAPGPRSLPSCALSPMPSLPCGCLSICG